MDKKVVDGELIKFWRNSHGHYFWTCPVCKETSSTENFNSVGRDCLICRNSEQTDDQKATVPHLLRKAAEIYEERNQVYGDNYKRFGPVMALLFPDGLTLKSADDFNRFGIFVQIIAKQTRYAEQFTKDGHADSLDDAAVYAMMLRELDLEAKK